MWRGPTSKRRQHSGGLVEDLAAALGAGNQPGSHAGVAHATHQLADTRAPGRRDVDNRESGRIRGP